MIVARVWRKHGLQPQLGSFIASNALDFENSATHVSALYIGPPAYAAIHFADEKTAVQAPEREGTLLSLSPGPKERHGLEYSRQAGRLFYAAFNTKTSEVLGKTTARHASAEFVALLGLHRAQSTPW